VVRSNAVGSYQVDARSDEHNVYFYSRLILRRTEIPLADYPLYKELMDQVAATTAERVVVGQPAVPARK
jgi:hypothetical protein